MTPAQKIALRISEVRQRLNTIAGLEGDAYTEDIANECRALQTEYTGLEERHRAALIGEGEAEARDRGQDGNGDGEGAEVRQLLNRVSLSEYLNVAGAGGEIRSAPAELNAALQVPTVGASGGVAVPWAMLERAEHRMLPRQSEHRAFTDTGDNDGPEMQRPTLQRLFGPGVLDTLGVRVDAVPVGRTEWLLISSGVALAQTGEGTAAAAAVKAGFTFANLKPKKLSGRYEYSHELAASVMSIEQDLRRDLADAAKAQMSNLIVNGAAPDITNPERIEGFLSKLVGTDLSAAEAVFADYGSLHARAVDGVHSGMETEVSSIVGDETYQHAAGVYQTGSGESGSEVLKRRSMTCMSSTYIPDVAATKQSAILHASGPNGGGGVMRGDSVAAVWPTLEVIRDIYTQASQGVSLTWVTLWDAAVAFRAAAYRQVDIQIES